MKAQWPRSWSSFAGRNSLNRSAAQGYGQPLQLTLERSGVCSTRPHTRQSGLLKCHLTAHLRPTSNAAWGDTAALDVDCTESQRAARLRSPTGRWLFLSSRRGSFPTSSTGAANGTARSRRSQTAAGFAQADGALVPFRSRLPCIPPRLRAPHRRPCDGCHLSARLTSSSTLPPGCAGTFSLTSCAPLHA